MEAAPLRVWAVGRVDAGLHKPSRLSATQPQPADAQQRAAPSILSCNNPILSHPPIDTTTHAQKKNTNRQTAPDAAGRRGGGVCHALHRAASTPTRNPHPHSTRTSTHMGTHTPRPTQPDTTHHNPKLHKHTQLCTNRPQPQPADVVVVSVMPCTAKKAEAARPEMASPETGRHVDYVLTTRELGRMLRWALIFLGVFFFVLSGEKSAGRATPRPQSQPRPSPTSLPPLLYPPGWRASPRRRCRPPPMTHPWALAPAPRCSSATAAA